MSAESRANSRKSDLSRRDWLKSAAALSLAASGRGVSPQWARADEGGEQAVLDIGDRNQVFIDGRFLDSARGCRIVLCRPRKTYEKCLQGPFPKAYATILEVDGVYRGFHALTKDGIHWRRVRPGTPPDSDDILGAYFNRACPFVDPKAPPEARYKRFNPAANRIRASSDGTGWKTLHTGIFPEEALFPHGMDSHNICFYDTRLKKYVAYVRVNQAHPAPPDRREYFAKASKRLTGREGSYGMRAIGRSVTDDLSSFPMPEVVFEFDEKDPHFGGVSVADFYTPEVIQYPYAQDAYFLFTAQYLHYEDWYLSDDLSVFPRSQTVDILNTGPLHVTLAASRDGVEWERFDRMPWIPLGPEGSFDSKCMYMSRGMYQRGDEIWMYYVGYDALHGAPKDVERASVLSRVVLLKDRFTGVAVDYAGGEFTTPPLRFEGDSLHLNLNTSAVGLARVEIQDAAGQAIEGFALEDCDRIHTSNTVDRVVTWRRGQSNVKPLGGRPIRLRFELRFGVKLHSFQFR